VRDRHAQRQYASNELDQAAANEVLWQWGKKRQFRRTAAALWTCWFNLAIERPEKLDEAAQRAPRTAQQEAARQMVLGIGGGGLWHK
jgi:transcription initiation factor TFIID subunit TAF12